MKFGIGYDRHLLEEDKNASVTLCGCKIKCGCRVSAHSDGDVVYHAVADCIAANFLHSSIGELFPDTDAKWKGADSSLFVREIYSRAGQPAIGNIDIIIVADKPVISPHTQKMRENLAGLFGMNADDISIRGRRSEDGVPAVECFAAVLFL